MNISSVLDATTIDRLEDILKDLRWIKDEQGDPEGDLEDKIDWLSTFINCQPISQLRHDLRNATMGWQEAETKLESLQRDHQLALSGVQSLKHLQKYEGHEKAESDKLGHEVEVNLLRAEIDRLRAELDKVNAAKA